MSFTANEILMILGALGTLISAVLVPGIILIIRELKSQTTTLDKIHLLTNSANTTSLQLVVDSAKKTAEATGQREDYVLLDSAKKALGGALAATAALERAGK